MLKVLDYLHLNQILNQPVNTNRLYLFSLGIKFDLPLTLYYLYCKPVHSGSHVFPFKLPLGLSNPHTIRSVIIPISSQHGVLTFTIPASSNTWLSGHQYARFHHKSLSLLLKYPLQTTLWYCLSTSQARPQDDILHMHCVSAGWQGARRCQSTSCQGQVRTTSLV